MLLAELDLNKVYTYADYYKWTFEERVELIKGYIFKMNSTTYRIHQEVLGNLLLKLGAFMHNKPGQIYPAPFDVRFPGKSKDDKDIITVLQPDLCVICDSSKLDARGCIGAPDIAVEILSPSNNKKELQNKYEVYEESGVKEYWVVMPTEKTMLIYTLTNGKYVPSRLMVSGDIVTSAILPGFAMDLTDIFSGYGEDEG